MWAKVAARLPRDNPWVIGYDPFNEPFGPGVLPHTGTAPGLRRPARNASTPGAPIPGSDQSAAS